MSPQQHRTPAARDLTPIRNHSPYSEAEGPIIDQGYVEARVRAIEGDFKQLWAPSSSEPRNVHRLPDWRLKSSQLHAPPETRMAHGSPSHDPFSDVFDCNPAKRMQSSDHGSPRQRHSLQQLSSMEIRSRDNPSKDRKSQSLANLRARYETSPLQSKARPKSSSLTHGVPFQLEVLSPQPISPSRFGMAAGDEYQEDAGFWNTVHPRALTSIPETQQPEAFSKSNKSIAERMSDLLGEEAEPELTGPSTVWDSQSHVLECPSRSHMPSESEPAVEAHPSSTAAIATEESVSSLNIERVRPSHKLRGNTVESIGDMHHSESQWGSSQTEEPSHQSQDLYPEPSKVQRSRTMNAPRRIRTSSVAAWRAKLRSRSYDQLADKRRGNVLDAKAPERDIDANAETSPSKLIKSEERQCDSSTKAQLSKSRQSSSTSVSASASQTLRHAWRRWSGWRLVLSDKQSHSAELPGGVPSIRTSSTDTTELKVEEMAKHRTEDENPSPHPTEDEPCFQRELPLSQADTRTSFRSPPPQSPKRPMSLLRDYSHSSISPIAPRATTALSSPGIPDWPLGRSRPFNSNTISSRPLLPWVKQSSQDRTNHPLHHARSAASVTTKPSAAQSAEQRTLRGRPEGSGSSGATSALAGQHHDRSKGSNSTETIYHSPFPTHKNSHQSMRSPWREHDTDKGPWSAEIPSKHAPPPKKSAERPGKGDEGRAQRIRRVKVIVSLDGAGDLVVNTKLKQEREGRGEGRVRSFVKRWEAVGVGRIDVTH